MNADPSASYLPGGPIGILSLHGFTGSAAEMRLIGEDLHHHGYTVWIPLLLGHGTNVADMNRRVWQEWAAQVEGELCHMLSVCEVVFVSGLSMGALLSLHLAAQYDAIAGVILYSPPLKIRSRLLPFAGVAKHFLGTIPRGSHTDLQDPAALDRLWFYQHYPTAAAAELRKLRHQVHNTVDRVTCPALVIHSTADASLMADSAGYTYARLGSAEKELVTLHSSGHCLTVDSEWQEVAARTRRFIARHSPGV